jgi:hypothetical protein
MLAAFGTLLMILGTYAFLALQVSMEWVGVVIGLGLLLMLGQILNITRATPSVAPVKGDLNGD